MLLRGASASRTSDLRPESLGLWEERGSCVNAPGQKVADRMRPEQAEWLGWEGRGGNAGGGAETRAWRQWARPSSGAWQWSGTICAATGAPAGLPQGRTQTGFRAEPAARWMMGEGAGKMGMGSASEGSMGA